MITVIFLVTQDYINSFIIISKINKMKQRTNSEKQMPTPYIKYINPYQATPITCQIHSTIILDYSFLKTEIADSFKA